MRKAKKMKCKRDDKKGKKPMKKKKEEMNEMEEEDNDNEEDIVFNVKESEAAFDPSEEGQAFNFDNPDLNDLYAIDD